MLAPSRKSAPLATRVYAHLVDDIMLRRRLAGERLVEAEIAREMEVSRTPVREALGRLQSDGLIRETRSGGYTVLAPSIGDIREIFEIRRALEPVAFRQVVEQADDAGDSSFRAAFDRFDGADSTARAVVANTGFRNFWMGRVPNGRMRETLSRFAMQVQLVRAATLNTADARDRAREGAQDLLDTYLARDPGRAEATMRRFVDTAYQFFERADEAGFLYPARPAEFPEPTTR
ncbi:GntR family transcriptional regulator [Marinibacterium sp. SX1]|uniref:GntR family transcriptional regulator n=1 Tax=Marinibacterium sp. SX1 TaxID=3388424 RepID=UPI003D18426C